MKHTCIYICVCIVYAQHIYASRDLADFFFTFLALACVHIYMHRESVHVYINVDHIYICKDL